jgi:uncharacterized protein YdbL (DUF1318 family)
MGRLSVHTLLTILAATAVGLGAGPAAAAGPGPSASTSIGRTQYTGDAYGSYAFVGSTVKVGKTAVVTLGGCGTLTPPVTNSNTVASVNGDPLVDTGLVNTTASATNQNGTQTALASADVHEVNVLQGTITADEVKSVAATSLDASGFHTSSDGSAVVNLSVNGQSFAGVPDPNTTIALPGLGKVVLNEQIGSIKNKSASFQVNMIHVYVTAPNDTTPPGTQIIVSHAASGLHSELGGTLDGDAYGTRITVGSVVQSGPSAFIALGCLGTGGVVKSNSLASIDLSPAVTTGTISDTVEGTVTTTTATAETTSTAQNVNLGDGAVTADVLKADAHSFTDGTTFTFSETGSTFVNLVINGQPFGGSPPPNTKIKLPGLGTLWLNRVIQTPNSIEVRMIELIVSQNNSLGIPVGSDIRVAVAEASAH